MSVIDGLRDLDVVETKDAVLQCTVNGVNYESGKWFQDGEPLKHNNPRFLIKTKHNLQQLIIKAVEESDAGNYAYVAGTDSVTQADLNVTPIEIMQAHDDVTTYETATVRFDVHLSHDGAGAAWYKNGELIEVSFKLKNKKYINIYSIYRVQTLPKHV